MHWNSFARPALALTVALVCNSAQADTYVPFADKHPYVDNMVIEPVLQPTPEQDAIIGRPFEQPVPRIIHQIWFGSPAIFDTERSGSWQQVAKQFGYEYHLWTEDDDGQYAKLFGREIADYIKYFRKHKRWDAASDVLRYHIVEHFGGMYFDLDVPAPRRQGELVDPATVLPVEGLALAGESDTREVGNSAFYVQNHMILAPPHNPVLAAITASLLPNRKKQNESVKSWDTGAIFITGQSLLSSTVRGSFTYVPYPYLHSLKMECWPNVEIYRAEMKRRYEALPVKPAHIDSIHYTP